MIVEVTTKLQIHVALFENVFYLIIRYSRVTTWS